MFTNHEILKLKSKVGSLRNAPEAAADGRKGKLFEDYLPFVRSLAYLIGRAD